MTGIINFETFLLTGILLNLTPGNDTIFILSRSIAQGRKAGIMSALGIGTGSLIHTVLAALGLSVIIANSATAFNIVKFAGAAYLFYLGISMLLSKNEGEGNTINYLPWKIYRSAVITNLLNPKVAIFFISFLPQFIDPAAGNTVVSFLLLGVTFTCTGTIWCLFLAYYAASLSTKLNARNKFSNYINKFCGIALILLSIKIAVTGRK